MIALLGAPSNLGLRPPQPGAVPGCAKAPEALRDAGLHARFVAAGAVDAGVVVAGRYVDDVTEERSATRTRVRNQDDIIGYTRRLARRIGSLMDDGHAPLVLGGDCSILLAAGLALRQRGRFGLAHVDGHTDFRHPGNSAECRNLAGEDLAAVIGRHWPAVSDIDAAGPYFDAGSTVHIGCRADDEHLAEVRATLACVVTSAEVEAEGATVAADAADGVLGSRGLDGYWLHVDVDVIDPEHMPAVDSPAKGGLQPTTFAALMRRLAPEAVGAAITIFDPDLDPDGSRARWLSSAIVDAMSDLGTRRRTG